MLDIFVHRARNAAYAMMLLGSAALMTTMAPAHAQAAEFELKFGCTSAAGTALYSDYLVPYARAIEADSGGRIAIDIRPQNGFGPPTQLLKQVQSGEIDMANTLPSYYAGRFPRASVMELPMMSANAAQGSRIAWTLYQEGLISDDFKDFKLLGLFSGANYAIFTKDKNVNGLRDLRGMRVRVSGGVIGLALSHLGMIPLGLPSSVVGKAFDRDWLDAVNIGYEVAASTPSTPPRMVIDEVSTLVDANLSASMQMLVMNKKSYAALPPDLQAVIEKYSGMKLSVEAGAVRDKSDGEVKQRYATDPKYHFVTLNADEKAEIAQRIAPVLDDWVAGLGAQGIDGAKLLARERELQQAGD